MGGGVDKRFVKVIAGAPCRGGAETSTRDTPRWYRPHVRIVRLFKKGRSQALRLPKEFRFEGVTEVSIRREGKAVILEPVEDFSWNHWWDSWQPLGDYFMPEGRQQSSMQGRDLDLRAQGRTDRSP